MTGTSQPGPTVEFNVHFKTGNRGSKHLLRGRAEPQMIQDQGRIPRVTKLMALAIRLDHLVRTGQVKDFAEIASLGRVTRARVSQIMDFNLLPADIQEVLLDLPPVFRGRDPITERDVRLIMKEPDWRTQRRMWTQLAAE